MAKFDIGNGLDDFVKRWGNLEDKAPKLMKMAVYDGAHVVYQQLMSNIDTIPDSVLKPEYRAGLKQHLGSSSIYTENGYTGEAFTMAGYIQDQHRKGGQVAAVMLARAANSGTSFSKPTHWIDNAMKSAKSGAEAKMAETFENKLLEEWDKE